MAAPLFEQSEIDVTFACEKYLPSEPIKKRTRYRSIDGGRQRRLELQISAVLPWPLEVHMDETVNDARMEVTFALLANIERRGREIICHYDIHVNEHENPPWSDGKLLKGYEPHKQIYQPANIPHGDLTGLRVAIPIKIKGDKSFVSRSEKLFRIFCDDLNIIVDKGHQMPLFQ